jgi:hypothetical protein
MASSQPQKAGHKSLVLGLLLILTVMIRLPILVEPWGADQAGFGHIGKGILEGKVPYKDNYDLTAYGVFFTFALFFKLFGTTMVAAHIGHLLVSVITTILVFFLVDRLYGRRAAVLAALCYSVFSNGLAFSGFGYENKSAWGTYWYLSQREVFMAPLILGAIFLTVLGEKKDRTLIYFLNGLLIGLAAFYKLTAVLILVLIILFTGSEDLARKRPFRWRKVLARTLLLVGGFILVQIPFLYYFWVHDALKDVHEALFTHLSLYLKLSRGRRIETFFSGHFSILKENLVLWLLAGVSCLYIFFRDRTRNSILVASWGIASLLMVWGQGKFFGYHFLLIVPPFSALAGYGLTRFFKQGHGFRSFLNDGLADIRKTFVLATIGLSIVGFGISNYDYYRRHVDYVLGKLSKIEYYDVFNEFPTHPYSFRSDYQVTEYLKANAAGGDRLGLIFSAGDTVIHFLTGLAPVSRFIQSWYLFPSDKTLASHPVTLGLRKELIDQMIEVSPRFILVVHIPWEKLRRLPGLRDDPEVLRFDAYIQQNYTLKEFPDNRFLYVKKADGLADVEKPPSFFRNGRPGMSSIISGIS